MGAGESRLASSAFNIGDKVSITLDNEIVADLLKCYNQDWRKSHLIGKVGTVMKIDHANGNVTVKYPNDEICVNPVVLAKQTEIQSSNQNICSGQLVRLSSNANEVKQNQAGHGEWLSAMEICLGKVGYVKRVFTSGDCRVYFGYTSWTVSPKSLKVLESGEIQSLKNKENETRQREGTSFSVGDLVQVSSNLAQVKRDQKGHGEWDDAMESSLGRFGFVKYVYPDKDLRVKVLDKVWTFNPNSIIIVVSVGNSPVGSASSLMGKSVKVLSDESKVRSLQNGHGGWASEMKSVLGSTGTVTAVQASGDVRVKVGSRTWTFNPKCVSEISDAKSSASLAPGAKVKVMTSESDVKRLQDGHGQWTDPMKKILGQEGKVIKIFSSGDIRVEINGSSWTLNPACVTVVSGPPTHSTSCAPNLPSIVSTSFSVGDQVKINADEAAVKRIQNDGGPGWVDNMRGCLGKVGTITAVFPSGNIKVKVNNEQWTFTKSALSKVGIQEEVDTSIRRGDSVRIIDDEERLKRLQDGHGEWIDLMRIILGRKGTVESILPTGDLRVKVMGTTWTINPVGCTKVQGGETSDGEEAEEALQALLALAQQLNSNDDDDDDSSSSGLETLLGLKGSIFDAARSGDVTRIQACIDKGDDINRSFGSHTALHVAANQGHVAAVKLLLEKGADHSLQDKDGDTPLHDAIAGGKPEAALEIIKFRGVNLNIGNKKKMTPLHMASRRNMINVVRQLIQSGAEISPQDEDGDTPLHDAIMKENAQIVDFLVEKGASLTVANERGFFPLHLACKQNNISATRTILNKDPKLVDERKEDGYTALHLTATNNHKELSTMLVERYRANVDVANNKGQTPLHLAVVRGHIDVVKLLVRNGAFVNARDEDGDTPLHETLRKYSMGSLSQFGFAGLLAALLEDGETDTEAQKEIALYLVSNGADTSAKNKKNQVPTDLCKNDRMKTEVLQTQQGSGVSVMKEPRMRPAQPPPVFQQVGATAGVKRSSTNIQDNVSTSVNNQDNVVERDINSKGTNSKKDDVEDLPDNHVCPICFDNPKNLAFGCGHVVCQDCSYMLTRCPFCSKEIQVKIPLFL